eukprot:3940223-Rhodomonas_salina.1
MPVLGIAWYWYILCQYRTAHSSRGGREFASRRGVGTFRRTSGYWQHSSRRCEYRASRSARVGCSACRMPVLCIAATIAVWCAVLIHCFCATILLDPLLGRSSLAPETSRLVPRGQKPSRLVQREPKPSRLVPREQKPIRSKRKRGHIRKLGHTRKTRTYKERRTCKGMHTSVEHVRPRLALLRRQIAVSCAYSHAFRCQGAGVEGGIRRDTDTHVDASQLRMGYVEIQQNKSAQG